MRRLPASTSRVVTFAAFLTSDHISIATGKTIAVTISKNGGSFANPNAGATNATEIGSTGIYKVTLDTTDTNTVGDLWVHGTAAATDNVDFLCDVVAATNGGMTALPNAVANAAGGLPISTAGALDLDEMNVDIEAIQVSTAGLTYTVANQVDVNVLDWKSATAPAMTGDAFARLGAPAGASIAADLAEIEAETDVLLAGVIVTTNNDKTGYALTSGERNSIADAMLDRDMSTGTDSGSTTVRTVRQALRFLRNKWAVSSGTLSVYKEDDSTASWTSTVGTDAAAVPIVSNDPAGP